jgi:hypothetical protein
MYYIIYIVFAGPARIFAARNLRDVLSKNTIEGYCSAEIVLKFFRQARKIKAREHAKQARKSHAKKQCPITAEQ